MAACWAAGGCLLPEVSSSSQGDAPPPREPAATTAPASGAPVDSMQGGPGSRPPSEEAPRPAAGGGERRLGSPDAGAPTALVTPPEEAGPEPEEPTERVAIADLLPRAGASCSTNADCSPRGVCSRSLCVRPNPVLGFAVATRQNCRTSEDCSVGESCELVDGACLIAEAAQGGQGLEDDGELNACGPALGCSALVLLVSPTECEPLGRCTEAPNLRCSLESRNLLCPEGACEPVEALCLEP